MTTSSNIPFAIEITHQGWLDGCAPQADLCSHGGLNIVIGGVDVTEDQNDFGISESALALMRTVVGDRVSASERERLIFDGSGATLMMGSPEGIDWDVQHHHGSVTLSNVVRYPSVSVVDAVPYRELSATVPLADYAREISRMATQAKSLFDGVEKVITDPYDKAEYEQFWSEYDDLLERVTALAR